MERTQAALEKARKQREQLARDTETGFATAGATLPPIDRCRRTTLSTQHLRDHRIVADRADAAAADVFKMLRTQVLQRLARRNAKTLAVCSSGEGEGKTMVAINLAIMLALEQNHSVLLVDLDFRHPSIHRYLGIETEVGLDDVLAGRASLGEALIDPGWDRLIVLPTRGVMPMSSEILMSERMASLVQELRGLSPNTLIVYDLPPVLQVDDCIAFLRHLDACLFVVEEGASSAGQVMRALDLIDADKLIGTVLNKASGKNNGYYHYTD